MRGIYSTDNYGTSLDSLCQDEAKIEAFYYCMYCTIHVHVLVLALYGVLYINIKHVEINTPLIPLIYAIYQKGVLHLHRVDKSGR